MTVRWEGASVARGGWAEPIYPVAELFIERSLRTGASFVTGGIYVIRKYQHNRYQIARTSVVVSVQACSNERRHR